MHARPIDEKGGDLYLISSCSSGWITRILLADVSGHGAAVADLASKLRRAMHRSINTVDQGALARELNRAFDSFTTDGRFATALLATYFAQSGHLILVNAGHPPPLILRQGKPVWEPIYMESEFVVRQTSKTVKVGLKNLPLGVIQDTDYEQIAIPLSQGDRVCLYTDAYMESSTSENEQIGVDGLTQLLSDADIRSSPIEHTYQQIVGKLQRNSIKLSDDDQTMILLEHNGAGPSRVTPTIALNWLKNQVGFGHTDSYV